MGVVKRLSRTPRVQGALGRVAAGYLRLVGRTNRFVLDPPDAYALYEAPADKKVVASPNGNACCKSRSRVLRDALERRTALPTREE